MRPASASAAAGQVPDEPVGCRRAARGRARRCPLRSMVLVLERRRAPTSGESAPPGEEPVTSAKPSPSMEAAGDPAAAASSTGAGAARRGARRRARRRRHVAGRRRRSRRRRRRRGARRERAPRARRSRVGPPRDGRRRRRARRMRSRSSTPSSSYRNTRARRMRRLLGGGVECAHVAHGDAVRPQDLDERARRRPAPHCRRRGRARRPRGALDQHDEHGAQHERDGDHDPRPATTGRVRRSGVSERSRRPSGVRRSRRRTRGRLRGDGSGAGAAVIGSPLRRERAGEASASSRGGRADASSALELRHAQVRRLRAGVAEVAHARRSRRQPRRARRRGRGTRRAAASARPCAVVPGCTGRARARQAAHEGAESLLERERPVAGCRRRLGGATEGRASRRSPSSKSGTGRAPCGGGAGAPRRRAAHRRRARRRRPRR